MSLFSESKTTMRLAVPLIIGQLSQMMMAVADTLMVGQLGVTELATLTFVNSVFYIPFVFSMGVLTGVSVLSSRARGAADPASARSSCRHGLFLSLVVGLGFFGLSQILLPWLPSLPQPPRVLGLAGSYLSILMASLIPALASIALKNHADAMNRPWPPFWIFLGGVALNVLLNWIMIFGHWGCPGVAPPSG
ncbi:MAG: hypothetical protein EAZ81_10700 [Verrucomicrobia bacterium]|nr:MAG: hypothetical protein EAZ81_10700 [Verrucomicrobiota bacterium]